MATIISEPSGNTIEAFPTAAILVKQTLIAGFKGLSGLSGVQVTYGDPIGGMDREVVYLGKIQWGERNSSTNGEEWDAVGAMRKKEVFRIEFAINVQIEGGTNEQAEVRAFNLLAPIELYLRSNPTIPYAKMTNFHIIPLHAVTFPIAGGADGSECEIRAVIHVQCMK